MNDAGRVSLLGILVLGACAAACSTSAAPTSASSGITVELTTESTTYRVGDEVSVQFRNRGAETVQVGGFCDRPLEQRLGDEWVSVLERLHDRRRVTRQVAGRASSC